MTGYRYVGGLLGSNNHANVINSYSTCSITGYDSVGGLVGFHVIGAVVNSYSTGSVTGNEFVGGLVGFIDYGIVSNCYSTGNVAGDTQVGALVGEEGGSGAVVNSFWDIETSGQATSAIGMGKTTTEMKDVATYSVQWDITGVPNPSTRDLAFIWNIVDGETYPFLSWQPVS